MMAFRSIAFNRPGGAAILSLLSSVGRRPYSSMIPLLRPLVALTEPLKISPLTHRRPEGFRCFSVNRTSSSLNDPSPNWSNRPPKETILLDGCDFEHWLVVVEPPDPNLTRDEIINSYIKTLAQVIGSEEEARFKIYSVSTKHYFAFGALVSEELSYKIKELPGVRWVLPDSYLDVKNKDYGGEPFINGEAVPYDPKYHEEWVRNNARAMERNRRNDRPRNMDRSRNFERRRENMQNFQNRAPPPSPPIQAQDPGQQLSQPPAFQNQQTGPGQVTPPMPGQNPQSAVPPPPFPAQPLPPNMSGQNYSGYQNRMPGPNPVPPMSGPNPGPPFPGPNPQHGIPPRNGPNYGSPSRDFAGFQNQMPNYQNRPPPPVSGYNGGGNPNPYQGGGGNPYQGGPPPSYQGGPPGYQGPSNPYQGNPGAPQPPSPNPSYQSNPGAPQPPNSSYQGNAGGGNLFQGEGGDSAPYQGQNDPGRRYQ